MPDLFIAFEGNSRRALTQIEAGWPDLGPHETAFYHCNEAHRGGRVLFFVGGKLNMFVGSATYVSNWSLGRSGPWKDEWRIGISRVQRFEEFVSAAEMKKLSGLAIPRDAMQIPSGIAPKVWKAARGLPVTAVDKRLEGMITESRSRYRNPELRSAALARANGKCEACGKNYRRMARGLGEKCLVVHHKKQLKDSDQIVETRVTDLAVLCANCHMMIHADRDNALSLSQLRKRLSK
jgi:predicted HNH restriction endonuclease